MAKDNYKEGRISGYKSGRKAAEWDINHGSYRSEKGNNRPGDFDPAEKESYAGRLLEEGAKTGRLSYSLYGAEMFAEMGMGDDPHVVSYLNKALEKNKKLPTQRGDNGEGRKAVERFISRHSSSRLEKSASAISMLVGIPLGVFLLTPTLTGNVIGNSTVVQNSWGIISLAVGIVGAYLFFRK